MNAIPVTILLAAFASIVGAALIAIWAGWREDDRCPRER